MQEKIGCRVAFLALLSLLAVFIMPQTGWAASTPTSQCDSGGTKSTMDATYNQNLTAHAQDQASRAVAVSSQVPLIPAANQCIQNLMKVMQQLPSLADPLGIASAVVNQLITSVINQACSAIMGTITSVQNAVTDLARICLPMPKFNGLDLPTIPGSGCSGSLQLNMLTGASSALQPTYNYNQYFKQ